MIKFASNREVFKLKGLSLVSLIEWISLVLMPSSTSIQHFTNGTMYIPEGDLALANVFVGLVWHITSQHNMQ